MFINRKSCWVATLLLLPLGRWGAAIGSDPLLDRLLSTDPGIQAQAVDELNRLPPGQKRIMVDELSQALRSNAASAQKAAHALAQLGPDAAPAIPDLIDALHYDEEAVYSAVAEALLKTGSDAVEPLRKCLSDSNFFVRRRAAEILGHLGSKARRAIPELIELLDDPETQVHNAAENALLQMGDPAVSALDDDLKKEGDSNRKSLVSTLARFGKPAAPVLVRVLKKDGNALVRSAAAEALSQMRDIPLEALRALMEAMHDMDEGMRGSAIDALGQMGKNAAPALGDLIIESHTDRDPLVRSRAHQAVENIGHGNKDSLPGLAQGMRQDDPEIRLEILDHLALSDISLSEASSLIALSQKDANPEVRIKGLEAASRLQKQSSDALPVLAVALADPQPEVRSAALQALGRMKQDPSSAANAIAAELKDPNPVLRQQTIQALANLGPASAPFLIQELKDSYSALSDQAAKAILKLGRDAIPSLEAASAGTDAALSKKTGALLKRIRRKKPASSS